MSEDLPAAVAALDQDARAADRACGRSRPGSRRARCPLADDPGGVEVGDDTLEKMGIAQQRERGLPLRFTQRRSPAPGRAP